MATAPVGQLIGVLDGFGVIDHLFPGDVSYGYLDFSFVVFLSLPWVLLAEDDHSGMGQSDVLVPCVSFSRLRAIASLRGK